MIFIEDSCTKIEFDLQKFTKNLFCTRPTSYDIYHYDPKFNFSSPAKLLKEPFCTLQRRYNNANDEWMYLVQGSYYDRSTNVVKSFITGLSKPQDMALNGVI